jgi:hypothetical protein
MRQCSDDDDARGQRGTLRRINCPVAVTLHASGQIDPNGSEKHAVSTVLEFDHLFRVEL